MSTSDPITRLNAALEGRYRIERELGEGGMATVYLADDIKHERKVALKVLKPELAAVVGAERFLAEIKTTANLQHPHILGLHDSGEADGMLFYVMPYVEGESLRERLDREHQLQVEEAVEIAKNVAEALQYAHQRGIIHRDIKPANILVQSGKPLVSDFGIALAISAGVGHRMTETGLSLGTPHYMSPEQATGDQYVGPATDTYALACVLYEMLVGEPPFTGSTPQAILGKIIAGETPSARDGRTSVPENVDAAVSRGLERLPADRFASAHDFASALSTPQFRHSAKSEGRLPATRRVTRSGWLLRAKYAGALIFAFASGVAVTFIAVGPGRTADEPVGPYCVWYDPVVETGVRQVSCDLEEILIADLLAEFGDNLGQGFVVGSNVNGRINASVPRQDWTTALSVLFSAYGWLAVEDASGNIVVSTIEDVSYREAIEPLLLRLHQIRYRDVSGLMSIVFPMLTGRGQATMDTLTNTLAVQDIKRVSEAVEALLQELDRPPQADTIG